MLTPINEALEQFIADANQQREKRALSSNTEQSRSLTDACGHILSEDVISSIDVPPCDNSAMDGIVLGEQIWKELLAQPGSPPPASAQKILVSDRITAGQASGVLQSHTCARIFTGAPIPANGACVVVQEVCNFHDDGTVSLQPSAYPLKTKQNIRPRGQDIGHGETVFKAGHQLRPQDIGLLASIGIAQVNVRSPLRIAVVNTGNELQMPGEPLKAGKIYNSNGFMLQSLLESMGCDAIQTAIVTDHPEHLKAELRALTEFDGIITTGGVSVGEEDHMRAAIEAVGRLDHWKLAIKPGKPLAFGHIDTTPVWGLPGNPVSAFVTFLAVVKPYLRALAGAPPRLPLRTVSSGFRREKPSPRQEYLRVVINDNNEAIPFANQSSGVLTSVTHCDGLAIIPANRRINLGEPLKVMHFNDWI